MKISLVLALAAALAATQACSTDVFKRTTYQALQNIAQQQCLKNPGADCPERERYDDYQRKREEIKRDE